MFEGQQFEHLGFKIPSVIRTTIMRKKMLFQDFEAVNGVVNKYNSIIAKLSLSEVSSNLICIFEFCMRKR